MKKAESNEREGSKHVFARDFIAKMCQHRHANAQCCWPLLVIFSEVDVGLYGLTRLLAVIKALGHSPHFDHV
jgi:hypothetical protein